MENIFEEYLEKLIKECMQGDKIAYLSRNQKKDLEQKIRAYFYSITINTLIDQLSPEQLDQVKDLDPDSPEMQQKMAEFAASIPGFAVVLEDKLKQKMDQILQTGTVPES